MSTEDIDLGFIRADLNGRAMDYSETGYGWRFPSGAWSGWYSTGEEAAKAAGSGAQIVRKTVTQTVIGISERRQESDT